MMDMKSKMQEKVAKTMRGYKEKAVEKSAASKPMPMRGQRTATNAMSKAKKK